LKGPVLSIPRFTRAALCAALAVTAALALALPASADQADKTDDGGFFDGTIHAQITPYVWLPTINGTFRYDLSDIHGYLPANPSGTIDSHVGPNNYLTNLNFALLASGQIRKGKEALVFDVINANIGNQGSSSIDVGGGGRFGIPATTLTGSVQNRVVSTISTLGASGTVYRKGNTSIDVLLGGRLIWLTTSTDWNLTASDGIINRTGSASKSATLGDAVVGTYGQFGLGKKWSIPFYLDAGTGDPNFTWQGLLGIKYGQLGLSYRFLDMGNGGSGLLQALRLGGPQLGYTLRLF
jgi:hypothetical protein